MIGKGGYVVQVIDLMLEPPATICNLAVDVDHLWLVPVILAVRPLLSVRVTHVRADPDEPSEAERRARIEAFVNELRQALPPAPIIQDMADKASALERGRKLAKLLPGSEVQEMAEGVVVVYPGEVDPVVFLRTWQPGAAGLN